MKFIVSTFMFYLNLCYNFYVIFQMDSNSEKRWDDSILLKEEVETTCMSKKEALLRRERIKQYSFNHRVIS